MKKTSNFAGYINGKFILAKKNAEKRGIAWHLTETDMKYLLARANGKCEVTGHPFILNNDGKREPWAPSIDRIDSEKFYTIDNVRLVCVITNYALHEFGESVFFEMIHSASRKYQIDTQLTEQEIDRKSLDMALSLSNRCINEITILKDRINDLEDKIKANEINNNDDLTSSVSLTTIRPISFNGENVVKTADFAVINFVAPQTVRKHYHLTGTFKGIRPVGRSGMSLLWPAVRA